MKKSRIAIFASGSGSNAENIIRYCKNSPDCGLEVAVAVCNRPTAGVIQRAESLHIPVRVLTRAELHDPEIILPLLDSFNVDGIVLAGFLMMIPEFMIDKFSGRIINIHPSLLPKYGGKGMYGQHIHEAVVAAGETETGITIHHVSRECDGGEIIFQTSVEVTPTDTPQDVEQKVHELEYHYYPRIIADILL